MWIFIITAALLLLLIIEPRWYNNIYVVMALLLSVALKALQLVLQLESSSNPFTSLLVIAVLFLFIPALMLTFSLLTFSNSKELIEKEGIKKSNLFSILVGLTMLVMLVLLILLSVFIFKTSRIEATLLYVIGFLLYFMTLYTATLLYAGMYRYRPILYKPDYIIVLGSGLISNRVPPLLASRLKKAVAQYEKYGRKPIIIVSGGQGHDEQVSEAFAMKSYIHDQFDIPDEAVIMEAQSTTTLENMAFSKEIVDARFSQPKGIFVTNNFHVLRGSFYAKKVGLLAQGVGSPTAFYYLPNAFTREFVGTLEMYKGRHICAIVLFSLAWFILFRANL